MKKSGKIVAIILAVVTAAAAAGVGVLGAMSSKVDDVKRADRDEYEYRNDAGKEAEKDAEDPVDPFEDHYYDGADYYGCPNSKRVKKLNLKKNKRQR